MPHVPQFRKLYAVASAVALVLIGTLTYVKPASAAEWQPYNTKLVNAADWMIANGGGVDAYSNGTIGYTSNDYSTPAVGMKWQCVELAQRLYQAKGWSSGTWGVDAVNIWGLTQ